MNELGVIKATCIGDRRVGKTSILACYDNGGKFQSIVPTIIDHYFVDVNVNNKNFRVSTIDTIGDDSGAKNRQNEYAGTDVFVLFFSIDDRDSFQSCRSIWIEELKSFQPNVPILLIGSKSELRTNSSDFVTYKQGLNMSIEIGAKDYHECSASNNQGLVELYQYIALIGSNKKYKRKDKNHDKIMCNIL